MSKQPNTAPETLKTCTKCSKTKLIIDFYTSRQTKDGRHGWCKECCKDAARARNRHADDCNCTTCRRGRAAELGLVFCPGCEELKNPDCFYRHSQTKNGLGTRCIECYSNEAKERYRHPDGCECRACRREAAAALGNKLCPGCDKVLPQDAFRANPLTADGLRVWCSPCEADKHKGYRGQHDGECECGVCTRVVKRCARCKTEKPIDEFGKNASNADGLQYSCRRCFRFIARQKSYKLTEEAFWEMYEAQDGKCRGCGENCPEELIMVDHDHACCPGNRSCGECIRGLLCRGCNTALGMIKDNPATAIALANYLMNFQDVLRNPVDLLSTFN